MSSRFSTTIVAAVLGVATVVAFVGSASAGDKELTPLGKWMKPNMGVPKAGEDFDALARAADFVAARVPPGAYGDWAKFSKQVGDAARAKDMKAVGAGCKGCHDAYKDKYKSEHKTRPFP